MKTCTKCKSKKPLDNFYRDARSKDGYYAKCKKCHNAVCMRYQKTHKEDYNTNSKRWSKANPSKVQAKLRRLRSDPAYRAKTNQWNANYKRNHAAKVNAINAERRARVLRAMPAWVTPEMKTDIQFFYIIREGMKCPEKWNVDHIWPLDSTVTQASGLHVPWNLRLILAKDNIAKKNKVPA